MLEQSATLKASTDIINGMMKSDAAPQQVFDEINRQIAVTTQAVDSQSTAQAATFTSSVSAANKKRVENVYKSAFSVDTATIIDGQAAQDRLAVAIAENVSLIRTIPSQHWAKVTQAVVANFNGQSQVGDVSLQQRLKDVGNISDNRARVIARDQTSKLNGDLTKIRHQDVGVVDYIWRTMQDSRVVGDPSGLYPHGNRVHGNHFNREGKRYSYSNPPADGNPADAINCRCFAEAILDLDNLNAIYV